MGITPCLAEAVGSGDLGHGNLVCFHGPHGAGKRAAGHNDCKIKMSEIMAHLAFACFHKLSLVQIGKGNSV